MKYDCSPHFDCPDKKNPCVNITVNCCCCKPKPPKPCPPPPKPQPKPQPKPEPKCQTTVTVNCCPPEKKQPKPHRCPEHDNKRADGYAYAEDARDTYDNYETEDYDYDDEGDA